MHDLSISHAYRAPTWVGSWPGRWFTCLWEDLETHLAREERPLASMPFLVSRKPSDNPPSLIHLVAILSLHFFFLLPTTPLGRYFSSRSLFLHKVICSCNRRFLCSYLDYNRFARTTTISAIYSGKPSLPFIWTYGSAYLGYFSFGKHNLEATRKVIKGRKPINWRCSSRKRKQGQVSDA